MRTEIALAVLGFVSVISLSSLLTNYVAVDSKRVLLDTVHGSVGWGNFSYWKLSQQGPLLLELSTTSGDADLYVADTERPSYEVELNNLSSATCGVDAVNVPHWFPRPIGIGVFGHWSHETSEYVMNVYLDTGELQPPDPSLQWEAHREPQRPQRRGSDSPLMLGLLSVLDVLVEMLIL